MNPYESLCYFDKRNPNGNPLPDDEDPQPRELGCACDNCFYGRDKLAMEVIRLREALEQIAGCNAAWAPIDRTCRGSFEDRGEWCHPCIAADALNHNK